MDLKFRAWNYQTNEMVYTDYNHILHFGTIKNWSILDMGLEKCNVLADDETSKLLLAIGRKDRDGTEVYIGDLVELNNKNYDTENDLYYEGIVEVVATEGLGYKLVPRKPTVDWETSPFDSTSFWHFCEGDTSKVIGNIFENPKMWEEL